MFAEFDGFHPMNRNFHQAITPNLGFLKHLPGIPGGTAVCGGFIVNAAFADNSGKPHKKGDVDIFVMGATSEVRLQRLRELTYLITRWYRRPIMPTMVRPESMTLCLQHKQDNEPVVIQIIMSAFETPYDVVSRFDVDACRAFYTPAFGVVLSPLAYRAWLTRTVQYVALPMQDCMCRLRKYVAKGFQLRQALLERLKNAVTDSLQDENDDENFDPSPQQVNDNLGLPCSDCRFNSDTYKTAAVHHNARTLCQIAMPNDIVLTTAADLYRYVAQAAPKLLLGVFGEHGYPDD